MPDRTRLRTAALLAAALALAPAVAGALELAEGRVQVHGFFGSQLRFLSDGYRRDRWFMSQWANSFGVELEGDIAPRGFGPFELVQGFARIEVRYECVYSRACGLAQSFDYFGNRAYRAPKNQTDARESGYSGLVKWDDPVLGGFTPPQRIHRDRELASFLEVPPLNAIFDLGARDPELTFGSLLKDSVAAFKKVDGTLGPATFPVGIWRPRDIQPIAPLRRIDNETGPVDGLPLRPLVPNVDLGRDEAHHLYVPTAAMLRRRTSFDSFDQNFSESELEWNHGAGQDEHELKEIYLDLEALEGKLFLRLGKQTIVWGKTEIFRNQDQLNPADLALASLPSLEESRLALWSARAIYSFYDVGPLEDVRLEGVVNLDDFEPTDLGRCGEPYTVWLVCGKNFGLFAHGISGLGVAGENRPPDPWEDVKGVEIGARLEFRWDRFSFSVTDFWGYSDFPTAHNFNEYSRRVDPFTGRPLHALAGRDGRCGNLDVDGLGIGTDPDCLRPGDSGPGNALDFHTGNRQLYDVFCSATIGIAGSLLPALANDCVFDLENNQTDLGLFAGLTPATALAAVFVGGAFGELVAQILAGGGGFPVPPGTPSFDLVLLNPDPDDSGGVGGPTCDTLGAAACLGFYLTDEQEALLGCGPFYGTFCDEDGIDVFNAEGSVLGQAFPQFEPNGPVATRFVNGQLVILPGAHGPGDLANGLDPGWNPLVDGCTSASNPDANCAGAHDLIDPRTGQLFDSEMAALSYNFLQLLAGLGAGSRDEEGNRTDPDCDATRPISCRFVRGIFAALGTQRPVRRAGGNGSFGRRDFLWHGGSELRLFHERQNSLGFSMDFAEDRSKTNWGVELTWVDGANFSNADQLRGYKKSDVLNLSVSVDRPTFVNFLNANRTLLFNAQFFTRYITDYDDGFTSTHGPLTLLSTFTVFTGFYQDRLLNFMTYVHDARSSSGALLFQVIYRFSESFSASVGVAAFYGNPDLADIPTRQAALSNNGGSFRTRSMYDGLSAISERDEVFLTIRKTF